MYIMINGRPFTVAESCTIPLALQLAGITSHNGIAVAVNNTVVPRSEWERYFVKGNDKLIVIKATQGG